MLAPAVAIASTQAGAPQGMVHIPSGSYAPLYRETDSTDVERLRPAPRIHVPAFYMDERPVTNAEFLEFVRLHPEWRRSEVRSVHADEGYLHHWVADLDLGPAAPPGSPVVNVSWFAAKAWCRANGRQLPTVAQWEYVAAASATRIDASEDSLFLGFLRAWYARPTPAVLPAAGKTFRNAYGIWDLHGVIWEWTLDFNSALVTGESRGDASLERSLFCGAAAAGASDFRDYAAFMRFAFRSSLQARYTVRSLGFRGVKTATAPAGRKPK
jgi:formylglycine-generating enzyme required for sulfatase activity